MKTPKEYRNMEFRDLIIDLVTLLKPKSYLELGVKNGFTFNSISKLVDKAYGVDIVKSSSVDIGKNCEFFQFSTANFYSIFKPRNEKIDFIFIDADHSSISVLNDVAMMKNFIRPYTGLIFLHDTFPVNFELLSEGYCFDAWKAAKQIKSDPDLEIVTIPGPWAGLSILRFTPNNKFGWMDED